MMMMADCGLTLLRIESSGLTTASVRCNFSLEFRFAERGGKEETTGRSLSERGGKVDSVEGSEGGADRGSYSRGIASSSSRKEDVAVDGGGTMGSSIPSCLRRFAGGKNKE